MSYTGLDDFLARARQRLDPPRGQAALAEGGEFDVLSAKQRASLREAAVLVGLIPRKGGATALLTRRPDTMANHPGQVAFPGGKADPGDVDAAATALREAQEEVGVDPMRADLIARGAAYVTGTGFRIFPVVAVLPAEFEPAPCETEVAAVFETPLDFLMNPSNHTRRVGTWKGRQRSYYEMPHGGFHIWGVTAGIIRALYTDVYGNLSAGARTGT
ncbi:MAG: CoA pyrophosphatase [Pseudomonadota bacterium]